MMESYAAVSSVYDDINKSVDYGAFADYYESVFSRFAKERPSLVLDLACGTGRMTEELDRRGYDMTGIDLSCDMLTIAKDRAYDSGRFENILYLCQDMTSFELYGTVDACVCTLDGMNYLTEDGDLQKTLSLVHNYLIPDGIFVFDLSTPYRFENIYSDRAYLYSGEVDGIPYSCAWQNMFDRESRLCEFSLSVFTETEKKGIYRREDEVQYQRCYAEEEVKDALLKSGFEILEVCGDVSGRPLQDKDERMLFAARCIK